MRYFLDMFSGIGGFALGAHWAGIEFDGHYFSEIDPYAVEVYQKRFPAAEALGDIRYVDYGKLPKGEWIASGGFPCQPHSVAGKKKGSGDERDLWPECARMLRELRPTVALFENVPGLFISNGGRFFNRILSDVSAGGYDAEWQIISASEIGAPHLRKRVWIICYPNNAGGGNLHWRTPDANMERGNRSYENMKARIESGKPLNLNDQLNAVNMGLLPKPMMWPTVRAGSNRNSRNAIIGKNTNGKHKSDMGLEQAVEAVDGILPKELQATEELPPRFQKLWPTPDVRGFTNQGSLKMLANSTEIKEEFMGMAYRAARGKKEMLWPTPRASDAEHGGPNQRGSKGDYALAGAVVHYPTPTANDAKNSLTESQIGRGTLTARIVETNFPTPTTPRPHDSENTVGKYMPGQKQKSLESVVAREGGQLNPDWVEALMGYPLFWTDIESDVSMSADYPQSWLDGSWENGIPRVITGTKNRVNRLKGLGNAVVPQIPMVLWLLIIKFLYRGEAV